MYRKQLVLIYELNQVACASGATDPAAPGSNPGVPEIFSEMIFREKIVDVAEVN